MALNKTIWDYQGDWMDHPREVNDIFRDLAEMAELSEAHRQEARAIAKRLAKFSRSVKTPATV